MTGLVGAAGGIGGFFLPSALGALRDVTGTYATGLAAVALVCAAGAAIVLAVSSGWTVRAPVRVPSESSPG